MLFLLICVVIAVVASRSPWVQALDSRALGPRGIALAAGAAATFSLLAAVAAAMTGVWPVAVLFLGMTSWSAYWAGRRLSDARVRRSG